MIEVMIALMGAAVAGIASAVVDQHRARKALDAAADALRADRDVLARAAQANETLAAELTRQRDQLASLEMRMGAAPQARGFPGR